MVVRAIYPVIITLVLISISHIESCGEHNPKFPPCAGGSTEVEVCTVFDVKLNQTVQRRQCIKPPRVNVYESWEFWTAIIICLFLVLGGVVLWRCVRYTEWYAQLKDSIRHEKNRTCTRCCVKYCCPCKACVKCCEPYTKPTFSELQEQSQRERAESVDLSIAYHLRGNRSGRTSAAASHTEQGYEHRHHHLHIDPKRSECVHPTADVEKARPSSSRSDHRNQTLEEVTTGSIVLA